MSATPQPQPQPRSQPSRKTKGAWRRNIRLSDGVTGLENSREENILTGNKGLIADQPSSSLFQTDLVGDVDIRTKTRKEYGPLKADQIIRQRSAVPAVATRKRAGDDLSDKVGDGILQEKRRKKNGVSHKEYQRLRQVAFSGESAQKDVVSATESASHDPWEIVETPAPLPHQDFLEPPQPKKAPQTLKHAPVSLRADGKMQASVTKPHAGRSYNPTYDDWNGLLEQEGDKERKAEEMRTRAAEEESERLERVAKASKEAEKENDANSDYESEWDGIQSDIDEAQLQVKRPRRKNQVERNKIKRRKEAEGLAKHEARMKQREEQAKKIKEIKAELEAKEAQRSQSLQAVEQPAEVDEEDKNIQLRRRKIGKHAVLDQPLELLLSDDLQDSLRKLRPEGNLLNDRFRTLMVQGKIEAHKPNVNKKAKKTVTEKWSHKDWKLT